MRLASASGAAALLTMAQVSDETGKTRRRQTFDTIPAGNPNTLENKNAKKVNCHLGQTPCRYKVATRTI
jgi:hypothetical protein